MEPAINVKMVSKWMVLIVTVAFLTVMNVILPIMVNVKFVKITFPNHH